MDITAVIAHDHEEQRRLFAILEEIDSSDVESLRAVWRRLDILLEAHAKAEEKLFYPRLLQLQKDLIEPSDPSDETEDAIHDHNEIRDTIADVSKHEVGSVEWRKAVLEVNTANGDHMAEEEREGLADFRRHISLEERHRMAVEFTVFELNHASGITPHDEDPKEYVQEHKDS
ncbi:hemerythrin domain-containing protein [Curtobacterium ammoniigenes]|uniref:hemerythrin domain-containing protein n=1 Tax=Curtobacterium ammoniigenes TaxID=395387 RepID=UPI00082B3C65|nr:hemerythrin domain-containing protein [Curtobacterium ammoniigenes]